MANSLNVHFKLIALLFQYDSQKYRQITKKNVIALSIFFNTMYIE